MLWAFMLIFWGLVRLGWLRTTQLPAAPLFAEYAIGDVIMEASHSLSPLRI